MYQLWWGKCFIHSFLEWISEIHPDPDGFSPWIPGQDPRKSWTENEIRKGLRHIQAKVVSCWLQGNLNIMEPQNFTTRELNRRHTKIVSRSMNGFTVSPQSILMALHTFLVAKNFHCHSRLDLPTVSDKKMTFRIQTWYLDDERNAILGDARTKNGCWPTLSPIYSNWPSCASFWR